MRQNQLYLNSDTVLAYDSKIAEWSVSSLYHCVFGPDGLMFWRGIKFQINIVNIAYK